MNEPNIPAVLLSRVQETLEPVKPLASPSRRLLALAPLALLLFFGPSMFYHWRENLSLLPSWVSWGLSAVESLGGLMLIGLALRQAVPGMSLGRIQILLALAAGALLFICISLITANALPATLHDWNTSTRLAWECVVMELPFAIPPLLISAWLIARALPTPPALTGAAYGLAVGLMTDAGMRLFCKIDEASHVLIAHGGIILLGTLGGALMASVIERRKYRRLQSNNHHSDIVT